MYVRRAMNAERRKRHDPIDEEIIDAAIELTGFGIFSLKIILITTLIMMNTALPLMNISFIVPASTADYNLTILDGGIMITSNICGMLISSYFWGCLANVIGRKYTLVVSLFTQGIFEAISSVISNYQGYLVLKFCSGISTNGQVTILRPYVGEFQPKKIRKIVLTLMGLAWTSGTILVPAIAWLIIPMEFSYVSNYFFFRSWNLFILICSLPAPILALWLLTFPETPKYIAEFGSAAELAQTLHTMYTLNTGKPFDEYLNNLSNRGFIELYGRLTTQRNHSQRQRISKCEHMRMTIKTIVTQLLTILKSPYRKKTTLFCTIMFCFGLAYYSMSPRFPDFFTRFENFQQEFPNETATICTIFTSKFATNTSNNVEESPGTIPKDVYIRALITNAASLPLDILSPLTVNKLGYKFYIVMPALGALLVTIGLFFVQSSTENFVLSAIYQGLCAIAFANTELTIIENYPTPIRMAAFTFGLMIARLGAVFGNLLIGFLIEAHCHSFIGVLICQFTIIAVLGFLIPFGKRKNVTSIEQQTAVYV